MDTTLVATNIRQTIDEHQLIGEGDYILLGLSGGPDSLCLFDVLTQLSEERGFALGVVHVNHRLRPGDAEADQAFVEEVCRERGVPCTSYVADCRARAAETNTSEEEAGRNLRYECFAKRATELAAEGTPVDKIKIAVAQNLNDQAETLLLRLLRGTGTDGLASMEYIRRDRSGFLIIRPLLDTERTDIEKYCADRGLSPRVDKTNEENGYLRNRIRNELLPYLEEHYNPAIREVLNRACRVSREDKDYLWAVTDRVFEEVFISGGDGTCVLGREGLKRQPPAIRHRLLKKAFESIGLYQDLGYVHYIAADKLLELGQPSSQIDLPQGYVLRMSYERVECLSAVPEPPEETPQRLKASILYIDDLMDGDHRALFDVDKMAEVYDFNGGPLGLIIARTREQGDIIHLAVGTKTIQDLFVDEKVPAQLRDTIYMAAIGNEILWIPEGVMKARYSDRFRVTEETKRVLILEMDSDV